MAERIALPRHILRLDWNEAAAMSKRLDEEIAALPECGVGQYWDVVAASADADELVVIVVRR